MDKMVNILDNIGSHIPGYKGYAEREGRRSCDKVLREEIVAKLAEVEKALYEKMNEAHNQKDKKLLRNIEETRKRLNTFSSRVKFAPYGATSFFAERQIKEDELCNIYQIDLDLAETIETLRNKVQKGLFSEIRNDLVASQGILKRRNAYINNFK